MAFFSGQDKTTLRVEGNDTNCFVSLIVDTGGTYQAAITRKLQMKKTVKISTSDVSYEFFGDGRKTLSKGIEHTENTTDEAVIQYFMLDIEKEEVINPLSYLDKRFDEIEKRKSQSKRISSNIKYDLPWNGNKISENTTFRDWLNSPKDPEPKQQSLFDEKTMKEMEIERPVTFDPSAIHDCIVKMITCSFIIDSSKFDLKQWITRHMKSKYEEIFTLPGSFESWNDFIVEWLIENYLDESLTTEDYEVEEFQSLVAQAMYDELFEYSGQNSFIDDYLDTLMRWTD